MAEPLVGILMGSESDKPRMEGASKVLSELEIAHEVHVMSAHRTPEAVAAYAGGAADRGMKVLIAGAGMAAHLAGRGRCANHSPGNRGAAGRIPASGVRRSARHGPDAPGIPVATVAIGNAGAKNARLPGCSDHCPPGRGSGLPPSGTSRRLNEPGKGSGDRPGDPG